MEYLLPEAAASWAAALQRLLPPGQAAAIECGGATAAFEWIAGEPLIADMAIAPEFVVPAAERAWLPTTGPGDTACRRWGVLRTGSGIRVAATTASLLTQHVPAPVLESLGLTPAGVPMPGNRSVVPLGKALHGLGVRRCQLEVTATPTHREADGAGLILYSAALLLDRDGVSFAFVTERVYGTFAKAFPPQQWPGVPAAEGPRIPPYMAPADALRPGRLPWSWAS